MSGHRMRLSVGAVLAVACLGAGVLAVTVAAAVEQLDNSVGQVGGGSATNHHLVIDEPGCSGDVIAYELDGPRRRPDGRGPSMVYFEADPSGGVAVLTMADGADGSIPGVGLTHRVSSFPDGSGVVQWFDGTEPAAFLSAKRLDAARLERLAVAIGEGAVDGIGFRAAPIPAEAARVAGSSCHIEGGFLGVETIAGLEAAQRTYLLDVDPSGVVISDGVLVASYDRVDGSAAVPTRPVGDVEWRSIVAASLEQEDRP